MYSREIAGTEAEDHKDAQYQCADCEASGHEWAERGRCTGDLPGDGVQLRVETEGAEQGAVYPEVFRTCPRGLLRADLFPDEAAVAGLVSHASAAEIDKRWPDVPARLYSLLCEWRSAESGRMRAEHEARLAGMRGKNGAR